MKCTGLSVNRTPISPREINGFVEIFATILQQSAKIAEPFVLYKVGNKNRINRLEKVLAR